MTEPSDDTLRAWLLHRLPPEQAEPLEQRLLQDDAFGERLREIEVDLIDDCARGRLDAADRAAVAIHLAGTTRDRERLRIAEALARLREESSGSRRSEAVDPASRVRPPAMQPARWSLRGRRPLAAALLASAAAVLVAVIGLDRRATVDRSPPPAAGPVSTVTLMASQQRSASIPLVRIAHDAATIRLQAEVVPADTSARYALRIENGERRVFAAAGLVPREAGPYRFVEVAFAAEAFAPGEHDVRIHLVGVDAPEQSWSVRIRRE